jgi:hypothetical protein
MKAGFTTSVLAHAALLLWGLIALPSAKPFDVEAIDALPVDLVPIADVSNISEGSKTAPKKNTASQAKVTPPLPRPESQKVGAAATDQNTPITEKASDTAAAKEATPPPPPTAQEQPAEKAPEPAPPKAETPPPAPEKPAEKAPPPKVPDAPQPKADTGEIAPKPDKPADKPADDQPKPAPPAPSTLPPSKPKPPKPTETTDTTPDTTPQKPQKNAKPTPETPTKPTDDKSEKFDPNQLAALLNKVDPSGGGGKASDQEASLGSENKTGPVANMTQSELDALTAAITACFNPPVGAEGVENLVVPLRVEFTPDGDLAGPPQVKSIPPGPAGQAVADAAVRAVQRCAPYSFLPPEKYDSWQVVNMNFSPPPSY